MSSSATDTQTVAVSMPQMGISVSEGTILEWRKAVGDPVEADETICDVTTDKVDVEIPCPATGVLARILAEPGETVPVGEPIAEIDTGGWHRGTAPDEPANGAAARGAGADAPPRATAPGSSPPSSAAWPTSTTSTSRRSRGTASAAGSARRT